MVSFDIKSLYTNVSIEGAMNAMKRALTNISEDELPIKKKDYIELVSLCVNFGAFVFKEQEYIQHRGLAMGSPLSAVMASLYMETLEVDKFIRIIGRGSKWFRYVDDILVIMPEESNINNKLRMLNDVNEHIQFTVEMEMERKLPFLDTLIHREDSSAKLSVYRKPTNRDDFIHYLSRHSTRTKTATDLNESITVRDFWKVYHIYKTVMNISVALNKIQGTAMNVVWKQLCQQFVQDFKGFDEATNTKSLLTLSSELKMNIN
ncbi:uncharacterized protein LOC143024398 [Oratosquilla oratoria]|uniref:uncharacterized protein LOC143024398 n=1 Tax=Oratosquilla oratoria TaxID=337810 RepID=UPI003F772AE4